MDNTPYFQELSRYTMVFHFSAIAFFIARFEKEGAFNSVLAAAF